MDTPYRTVEQIAGMKPLEVDPTARGALSRAPDLEAMADSTVPGTSRHHVRGPQQTAVDPAAAGLDTAHAVHSAHARARAAMEAPAPAPEEAQPPAEAPATETAPVAAKAPAKSAPAAPAATA